MRIGKADITFDFEVLIYKIAVNIDFKIQERHKSKCTMLKKYF